MLAPPRHPQHPELYRQRSFPTRPEAEAWLSAAISRGALSSTITEEEGEHVVWCSWPPITAAVHSRGPHQLSRM